MDEKKDYSLKAEQIARFAKALAHPFGDIHEELPIAKATVSQHLRELKDAGLIQGTIEAPKVRYCINRDNWQYARELFADFFANEIKGGSCGCDSK